jgi:hypothetical protein
MFVTSKLHIYIMTLQDKANVCILQAYEWLFEVNLHGMMPMKGTKKYDMAVNRALFYTSKWNDLTLYNYIKTNY